MYSYHCSHCGNNVVLFVYFAICIRITRRISRNRNIIVSIIRIRSSGRVISMVGRRIRSRSIRSVRIVIRIRIRVRMFAITIDVMIISLSRIRTRSRNIITSVGRSRSCSIRIIVLNIRRVNIRGLLSLVRLSFVVVVSHVSFVS